MVDILNKAMEIEINNIKYIYKLYDIKLVKKTVIELLNENSVPPYDKGMKSIAIRYSSKAPLKKYTEIEIIWINPNPKNVVKILLITFFSWMK